MKHTISITIETPLDANQVREILDRQDECSPSSVFDDLDAECDTVDMHYEGPSEKVLIDIIE